jgi:predicted enzyme related to lactoylglutathione lyase
MPDRERVSGIGGIFFKAGDPRALADWYREHLGIPVPREQTFALFTLKAVDATGTPVQIVWSTFASSTTYFGPARTQFMVNYRVQDLDAMLAQLRAAGAAVHDRIEESENGRFGWATDPEGNRFELWEPPPEGI